MFFNEIPLYIMEPFQHKTMIFLLVVEILQERIFSDENRTVIDKSRLLHLVITIPAKKNLSVSFSVL